MQIKKIKFIGILFIIIIVLISINMLKATTIIIKSEGRSTTIFYPSGGWSTKCDNSTNQDCTISFHFEEDD